MQGLEVDVIRKQSDQEKDEMVRCRPSMSLLLYSATLDKGILPRVSASVSSPLKAVYRRHPRQAQRRARGTRHVG